MSLAADALQPLMLGVLFTVNTHTSPCNLADVITPGPKAGFDLDFDDVANTLSIDFRDPSYIGRMIAGDALRFASAAFVSLKAIEESIGERASLPWAMIRLYYGAFYAGHSVLRIFGQSCSYLDHAHINKLQKYADALGIEPATTMQRGVYHCVVNSNETGLVLARTGNIVGGAHETFWGIFDEFLGTTMSNVLVGQLPMRDAQSVFAKLEALRAVLKSSGGGPYCLSAIRNDIQYRHSHGVWLPQSIKKKDREQLARFAAQWTRDPMNVDIELSSGSLSRFVVACAFIIALCRTALTRIEERSSGDGASFARAPLSLC